MDNPGPVFNSFSNKTNHFTTNLCEKYPSSNTGAEIQTHDFLNTSLL